MPNSAKGKIIVITLRLLAFLPLSLLRVLGSLVGCVLWFSNSQSRQVTEKNLALCFPELSELERRKLAKSSLKETAKTFFETAGIWHWSNEKTKSLLIQVENEQALKRALEENRGLIIAAPHLGNWEELTRYFPQFGKMTALYLPTDYEALNELILKGRTSGGIEIAPTTLRGVSKVTKALKAGNITGILPDQEPEEPGGVFVPFFGIPTFTMTLVSNLARKTNAVVLVCYAERIPGGFKIHNYEVDEKIYDQDDLISVSAMNESVEKVVRQSPEQYQWEYKRFKKRVIRQSGFYKQTLSEMKKCIEDDIASLNKE